MQDIQPEPGDRGSLMSRVKKARQKAIEDKIEDEMSEEDKLKEQM